MDQKGLIPILLLIGLIIISGVGVAGTFYLSKTVPSITPFSKGEQFTFSPHPSSIPTGSNTQSPIQRLSALQMISGRGKVSPSSPSPIPLVIKSPSPAPPSYPTPMPSSVQVAAPTPASPKNTCDVNVIYGKLGGGASDPLLVTLIASFTSHNSAYLTGAQWDFDGNGSWDTDLKQLNGNMEHTYPQAGTYTAKLQVQGSDGSMTDVCSKSLTVPSGITVKLTGRVYADVNCNDTPEPNEKGVAGATVEIMKMPEFFTYATLTTDSNGYYNFSQNIQPNDALSVSPISGVVPSGYKINPYHHDPTFALNSNQSSINVDIPLIPYENVGACTR